MNVYDAIRTRRSLRRYDPRPIPRAVVEQVLDAGRWSPSAHNRQPWRFCVVENASTRAALADAMGARLADDLTRDNVPLAALAADVQRSRERLTGAAILIILCMSMRDMDVYRDVRRATLERTMAVQSVAMAGQNILLAAHEAGLGACWMCAPLFCADVVQGTLQLPDDWEPQGLLTLGYPAQTREKTREALETRTLWR